jgi:hypothetical protein
LEELITTSVVEMTTCLLLKTSFTSCPPVSTSHSFAAVMSSFVWIHPGLGYLLLG